MNAYKEVKRRGVLSPEQPDFLARRLKAVKRRHRAWLRSQVRGDAGPDEDESFNVMFD